MKKNRHFIMFVIMLIMMTMMATLATRQAAQTSPPLVEVFFEYENGHPNPSRFSILNVTDEMLEFTKRYEVWRIFDDETEGYLVYAVDIDEIFFLDVGRYYYFNYDFSGGLQAFIGTELDPGLYTLVMGYNFSSSERDHGVFIQGHRFAIW